METQIEIEAEQIVREAAAALTSPREGECLACFLARALSELGCSGSLRLARHYRDAVAPRVLGMEQRLERRGGFCDCEVLMNAYSPTTKKEKPCRGARRGSTKPCELWVERRRR